MIFTKEELENFTVKQLKKLAEYYKVPYNTQTKKPELVTALAEVLGLLTATPDNDLSDDGQPMTVQVKRIKEWLREHGG